MIFERYIDALEYSVSQFRDTGRKHKAVKAKAWVFDRQSGEYTLLDRFTVILV